MDGTQFDLVSRALSGTPSRRGVARVVLGLLLGAALASQGGTSVDAKRKKKPCGPCKRRKKGRCRPKPDNTSCGGAKICQGGACVCPTECCRNADCGGCELCQGGQCVNTCLGGRICQGVLCACPGGTKECQGTCIPNNQCCGACPQGQTCCTNVGLCKDLRNDADFCGGCANSACPGGAFCANGDCGLACQVGQACFEGCTCGTRADPAHDDEAVCATLVGTCQTATFCADDATCGFGRVCVSGLCPPFNACADPCT
jgi:hypothetical protein